MKNHTHTWKAYKKETLGKIEMGNRCTFCGKEEQLAILGTSRSHNLFYGSSYDRGLDFVLRLWPQIIEKFPDAKLHICYGWDLFIAGFKDNPERMAWMDRMNKLMEQKGIVHHGRLGKKKLAEVRSECGIWIYPTYFAEINCITALECQCDGLVPVVMNYAALKETVQSGIKVDGDIYDEETQEEFLKALFKVMEDTEYWKKESEEAQKFAKGYDWDIIAKAWEEQF